jgi:hypothetical protein
LLILDFFRTGKNGLTDFMQHSTPHARRWGASLKLLLCLCLAFASARHSAFAQTFTGAVNGSVKDSAGAAVAGAAVEILNSGTGELRRATSSADGGYSFSQLMPGTYNLTVTAAGFKKFVKNGIPLEGNQTAEQNANLEIGDAQQVVEVSASSLQIDSETASKDVTLTQKEVVNLPTSLRNPLYLVRTTAGVASVRTGQSPYMTDQNQNRFSLNGGRDSSTAVLVDGAPITAPDMGLAIITPSPEVVGEVQIKRTAYDAQFSRTDGGIVSVITKSGTNDFHGSVFEYLRNSITDSNTWDNNRASIQKPLFQRNQFGASLGGPLWKSKGLFFYGGYEGVRLGQPRTFLATVPTAAERSGDFSQTLNSDGSRATIYNPFSTVANAASSTGYSRTPFAGNVIPASFINPVGSAVANLFALPNITSSNLGNGNNYGASDKATYQSDRADVRVDYVINEKDSLFGRFTRAWQSEGLPTFFGKGADSFDGENHHRFQAVLGNTWTPTPNWVVNILLSSGRWIDVDSTTSLGYNGTEVGLPAALVRQFQANTLPQFTFDNYTQLGRTEYDRNPKETHDLQLNVTREFSGHSLRFGWVGELQRLYPANVSSAYFNFTRGLTSGPDASTSSITSGNAVASLLLGTGASGDAPYQAALALQQLNWGWYVQDSWRATSRLTIGVGLRYEIQGARTERFNRLNYFATQATSPLAAATGLPLKGGLAYVGNGDRGLWDTDYSNFAPRLSVAYKITDRLVFRSGYGIFNPSTYAVSGDAQKSSDGYSADTVWNSTAGGNGLQPLSLLSNPFPQGLTQPNGAAGGLLTQVGQNVYATQRSHPTPYVQTYSADFQYQLLPSAVVEAGYIGTQGRKLLLGTLNNLNQLPSQYLSLGSALNNSVANPFAGSISSGPLSGATIPYWRTLVAYPQFTGVNLLGDTPGASSSYNALTLKYTQRLTSGLTVLATYQWSKAIDDTSETQGWEVNDAVRDVFNRRLDRSISAHNLPYDFVGTMLWQLPFGHGKRFGSNMNKVVDGVLGGWEVTSIVRLGAGLPLQFRTNNTLAAYGYTVDRPNVTSLSALQLSKPSPNSWFNTSAVSTPGDYAIGNMPRYVGNIRTGPTRNADLSLSKSFPLWERSHLQVRAEAYNISNTPQYGRADTTLGDASFGQVTSTTNVGARTMQFAARIDF